MTTDQTTTEYATVRAGADAWLTQLTEWVSIPSVSADPVLHPRVLDSAEFLAAALRDVGFPQVEVWTDTAARPAVWAHWPAGEPGSLRVLVYGHHDVQPAALADGWDREPFEPVVADGILYGRGASDDKGNVALHLLGVRAHLAATRRTSPAVDLQRQRHIASRPGPGQVVHRRRPAKQGRTRSDCRASCADHTRPEHRSNARPTAAPR